MVDTANHSDRMRLSWWERPRFLFATVALALGLAIYAVGGAEPEVNPPPTTVTIVAPPTSGAPRTTIQLEDLAAELANQLGLTPEQEGRVIDVLTGDGDEPITIVTPTTPATAPPRTTTTTSTTTTTTTTPPVIPPVTLPPGLLDQFRDEYTPPTTLP
jgi:hypothetical protein